MTPPICPLCLTANATPRFEVGARGYFECAHCDLLFTSPDCLLDPAEEKRRYGMHENDLNSEGYVTHLSKLTRQLLPKLTSGDRGIDFGCDPTPVLVHLIQNSGFPMVGYDPHFGPLLPAMPVSYDFLTCTEAAEHFQNPNAEFRLIQALVKPGGRIAIMTSLREGQRRDASWWYLRDPTHRCFYSRRTADVIALLHSWKLETIADDVLIFQTDR